MTTLQENKIKSRIGNRINQYEVIEGTVIKNNITFLRLIHDDGSNRLVDALSFISVL